MNTKEDEEKRMQLDDIFGSSGESDLSEADEELGSFEEQDQYQLQQQQQTQQKQSLEEEEEDDNNNRDKPPQKKSSGPANRREITGKKIQSNAHKSSLRRRSKNLQLSGEGDHSGSRRDDDDAINQQNPALQEFDSVVSQLKSSNKRLRDLDEEMDADELIAALCAQMKQAVHDDVQSNQLQQAATARLKLLPRVEELLRKPYLHEQLLEHETLECVRMWLEPLPDGSMPNLNIRRSLLVLLEKMPIDTDQVRESRIGRIVMSYVKNAREIPEVKQMATRLIHNWSRPLLQRNHNAAAYMADYDAMRSSQYSGSGSHGDDAADEVDGVKRVRAGDSAYAQSRARIPVAIRSAYVVQPESRVDIEESLVSGKREQSSLQKKVSKMRAGANGRQ